MAFMAFVPGGDAPGDVDDEVTLMLLSQRPMIFQNSEVDMQKSVGAFKTAVDDAVDHGLPPECATMPRNVVVVRTHLDVFRRALLGDPSTRLEPIRVRLQPGAMAVRVKPPPESIRLP